MRKRFGNLSIKRKILLIIILTSALSLFLSFAAYTANNIILFKSRQVRRMATLAQIIADNSQAALSFNDTATAEEIINSLRADARIQSAALYRKDGRILAAYKNQTFPALSPQDISRLRTFYQNWNLYIYFPVEFERESIGLVYFKVDMEELRQALIRYVIFGTLIFIIGMAAAYAIALRMQRSISEPLNDLTKLAESVSRDQNYALRAIKQNDDELGKLVMGFNDMLEEIQEREEAILKSNQALVRSNRDLEQFTYVASHDLQEPLRIVTVYSQLLAQHAKTQLDAEGMEFIRNILEGSKRSQQLISDLLEYSHTRSRDTAYASMDSGEALLHALSNLKVVLEESRAKITHGPMPVIRGDKMRIIQLFQNLISNAVKFKNQNGEPEINISCGETPEEWVFSVRDNGIGIAPEFLDRIFIIFQRLHTRSEYPGTGIGLAICKKIVEKHGGRIWVDSELGKGSVFHFTIHKPPAGLTAQ